MNKKLGIAFLIILPLFMYSCSGGGGETHNMPVVDKSMIETPNGPAPSYDPTRGEGKFDSTNLQLGPLDASMATKGKSIAETKCVSCHKMTDEKLVGPGWKRVTIRRTPYWIMNFITDPDPMIDKDPEVQAQLELCLVRMPNQNLVDDEARSILEFMRQNDGQK